MAIRIRRDVILGVLLGIGITSAVVIVYWMSVRAPRIKQVAPERAGRVNIARGEAGLELGMSLGQAQSLFKLQEETDPVAAVEIQIGLKDAADEETAVNKLVDHQFYNAMPAGDKRQLPDGVDSVHVEFAKGVLYSLKLDYTSAYVDKVGWQGFTFSYLGRYGKPTKNEGSSYIWEDERTELQVWEHGNGMSVAYSDLAIREALKDWEVKAKDLMRQQKQK